jgi:hypothetical protein
MGAGLSCQPVADPSSAFHSEMPNLSHLVPHEVVQDRCPALDCLGEGQEMIFEDEVSLSQVYLLREEPGSGAGT